MTRRSARREGRSRAGFWVVVFAVVLFGAGALVAWQFLRGSTQPLETLEHPFPAEESRPKNPSTDSRRQLNILVLGTLSAQPGEKLEENLATRAEAVTIFHLPEGRRAMQVVSIPADLDLGSGPLASLMAEGTVADMVAEMEQHLTVRMDHVMLMDFNVFDPLTEAVGGIELSESATLLNGHETVELLDTSRNRITEQSLVIDQNIFQDVLRTNVDAAVSPGVRDNTAIISDLTDALGSHAAANPELNSAELLRLGRSMRSISPGSITWCEFTDSNQISTYREMFVEDTLRQCNAHLEAS